MATQSVTWSEASFWGPISERTLHSHKDELQVPCYGLANPADVVTNTLHPDTNVYFAVGGISAIRVKGCVVAARAEMRFDILFRHKTGLVLLQGLRKVTTPNKSVLA